jgi:hypothetical protein
MNHSCLMLPGSFLRKPFGQILTVGTLGKVFTNMAFQHYAEYGILYGSDLNFAEFGIIVNFRIPCNSFFW